ncbi:DUF4382 domain-containing protein [Ramlibacter algicola]|uniref:DUF4382 domain-containing protein n=1 Tax=Ramlibacter algicola TaxID=2795217 RepID=A0A934URC6_9BURK|nr:DUF4382 domain-containing protein [Ramlibacter algicola]MBK0392392.1 DUF4382 domain-containing protein [Ramlibacter algicola]
MRQEINRRTLAWTGYAGVALAASLVVACGGGGGGGGTTTAQTGTLRMAMTDAPACGYDHVYVTVDRVRVHQNGGAADGDAGWSEIALAAPKRIDLLTLTNGVLEELGSTQLPAGSYTQVRLVLVDNNGTNQLANAVQPTGGALVALATPSAQQSGLKLKTNFEVQGGQTADLLLDFDACRSVVRAGNSGNYILKPVVSVTPRVSTGIEGYVSTTLTLNGTLVTAQQNGAVIRSSQPDTAGKFTLPSLPAGSYDIVVTSDGRSTAVVPSVPVTATQSVTLNGTATAILPPASTMQQVTGTTSVGTGTATLVTDASVRATQALTGGPTVEVAHTTVDASTAAYTLRLPAAAPVKSPFAAGTALNFTADTAVAGKYRIEASAPSRTTIGADADVSTADKVVPITFSP